MKCGYVAVLGRPNAGKSSLMNFYVGEDVAVVSKRQQTTRSNILGIVTGKDYQIVFIDTPGIHHSKNELDRFMMKNVRFAISTADVVLYLFDAGKEIDIEEKDYIEKLREKVDNLIVVKSKIDKEEIADYPCDIKVSIRTNKNTKELLKQIISKLPEQEQIFDNDEYTDKSIKFLVCEYIRGMLLDKFDNEIPHGIAVVVEDLKEDNKFVKMDIALICERENHKGIIIGKNGENLKEIGIKAREYAEDLFNKQVVLHTFVKVDEDWRNRNITKYF